MSTGRRSWIAPCLLIALSGCAQSGGLLSQRTSMGTLKTSLSHMEYENQQLRREVASLKVEARQFEDRLVQEESRNGELTANLDDARDSLRRRGLSANDSSDPNALDPGPERPRKTLPAGRSSKKGRKPPFAQIPGRIETVPPADDDLDVPSPWESQHKDDAGPQSRNDNTLLWLPVARGAVEPTTPRR